MLQSEGIDTTKLSFVFTDLNEPNGWDDAMKDIDYVLHVASPLGGDNQEDPSLISISKDGVEYVLNAAIRAGIKKVVMTSSEAANYPDKYDTRNNIDEEFWTDPNNKWITNYMRSKLIAEQTAWEIVGKQSKTQLVTILPGAIPWSYPWTIYGWEKK